MHLLNCAKTDATNAFCSFRDNTRSPTENINELVSVGTQQFRARFAFTCINDKGA